MAAEKSIKQFNNDGIPNNLEMQSDPELYSNFLKIYGLHNNSSNKQDILIDNTKPRLETFNIILQTIVDYCKQNNKWDLSNIPKILYDIEKFGHQPDNVFAGCVPLLFLYV